MELHSKGGRSLAELGFKPALEVIDFQDDKTGAQLEMLLSDIQKLIRDVRFSNPLERRRVLQVSSELKHLEDYIFDRFGIKTKFNVMTMCPGAIMPMIINENHILIHPIFRGEIAESLPDQAKVIEKALKNKGTVDLVNAKVGGVFSEYEHEVHIDFVGWLFGKDTNARHPVSVLLHELGHAFTYYEFADRAMTTNQVLANLSQLLGEKNINKQKMEYNLRELERNFNLKQGELDDLLTTENKTIFGLKLFKRYITSVKSQLKNAHYDRTASEQLADNFATRFGYGRDLIQALDNMYPGFTREKMNKNVLFIYNMLAILYQAVNIISTISAVIAGAPFALLYFGIIVFNILISGESGKDMTYDELKIRYTRIRHQYIEMISTLDIPKDKLKGIIEDVHHIDSIIQKTNLIPPNLYDYISNFLFSKDANALSSKQEQYLLEELAHNDLFLASAKLKTL